MKNKLAIFDMDGTLFDTKDVNYHAYMCAIEECGLKVDIDYIFYCEYCNGNNYKNFLPLLVPQISEEEMEKIHNYKKQVYPRYLKYARKNELLFSIIQNMQNNFKIALVTTASRKNTEDILNTFNEKSRFDLILTQEDVIRTKPDPEGFLLALEKTNIRKKDAIIFEDSETGIAAAKASGISYVQVYGYN